MLSEDNVVANWHKLSGCQIDGIVASRCPINEKWETLCMGVFVADPERASSMGAPADPGVSCNADNIHGIHGIQTIFMRFM